MFARLKQHIGYLLRVDPRFPLAMRELTGNGWRRRLRLLDWAEGRRLTLAQSGKASQPAHVTAWMATQPIAASISERDFVCQPPAARWIAWSLNAERALRSYQRVSERLEKFLSGRRLPVVGVYGGVKGEQAILKKIASYKANGADLDLWDVARFRIVTPDLQALFSVGSHLLDEFEAAVVRRRNYYLRPREGPNDPYRAVHFELQDEEGWFVEVQIMTALRDAVGMVDHSLVRKRSTAFIDAQHEQWLKDLSHAANLLDADWNCGGLAHGEERDEPEYTGDARNDPDIHSGSGGCPTREPASQESIAWVQPGDSVHY
jgi:ppGpp synthetase/RelA/SpoT-type nucleotidyltranferase